MNNNHNNNRDRNFKKPKYRSSMSSYTKRRLRTAPNIGLLIFAFIITAAIIFSVFFIIQNNSDDVTSVPDITEEENYSTSTQTEPPFQYVQVSEEQTHEGYLILVNSTHEYIFPKESNVTDVFPNKNKFYSLSTSDLQLDRDILNIFNNLTADFATRTGFNDLLLNSAFRSYNSQVETYNYFLELLGEEATAKRVAVPGYSEHHTGYAFDIAVFKDGAGSNITEHPECAQLTQMLPEYGFILRYPDDKVDITGIGFEPWHYRYVGSPHSIIIKEMGICLEEYTDMIKEYTPQTTVFTYDGKSFGSCSIDEIPENAYGIYFIAVSESTSVPVPKGREYTISGNNAGGVVVTVNPKQ